MIVAGYDSKVDGIVTTKCAVTMLSRSAVTSLLVYNQCVIQLLVTDDSNFRYLNSHVEVNLLKVKKGHNFRFMGHSIYLCYQFLKSEK